MNAFPARSLAGRAAASYRLSFIAPAILLLGFVSACKEELPLDSAEPIILEGPWALRETISYDANRTTCNSAGTLSIAQESRTLAGSYTRSVTCGTAGQVTGHSESGTLIGGRLEESTVRFKLGDCEYRGVSTTAALATLSGTVLCVRLVPSGTSSSGAGTWRADRLEPPKPPADTLRPSPEQP